MSARLTPAETMVQYEGAAASHDLTAVLALIDEDAVYWFSDMTCHVGKAAVEAAIRSNFDSIRDETYEIQDLRWISDTDDVAVCTYGFRWSGTVNGRPTGGAGRGTNVLVLRNGDWVITHEHLSKGPAG